MQQATLRLFRAVQVNTQIPHPVQQHTLARTIQNGYVIDPTIEATDSLLDAIEEVVGISGQKANASFHKSWSIVQETPMEQLVVQQIVHYITTYGFEELGIYSADTVYIPHETLELPSIREDLPLIVIKGKTKDEILEEILKLGSGIALAQETLDDIVTIVHANGYDGAFIDQIRNRELQTRLYDFYGLVPSEPVEFLRYIVNKLTSESLLIKSSQLIEKIKDAEGAVLDALLPQAPDDLASIFLRYKPIFLALKTISSNKTFFNRLRKQADKQHKPLPEDYLNSITVQIKRNSLDYEYLAQRLEAAPIFRKIRLAYALKYRLSADGSTVYRIRNGRGWATEFAWHKKWVPQTHEALRLVLDAITREISVNVEGKTIYIPPNVYYALPATEKQFTGNFPTGTYITVPHDMVIGIHWTNTTDKRVDLDLSVVDATGKFGWDASFRSKDVLFSGDVTDAPAPNGASELFYLKKGLKEGATEKVMMVNYYNFRKDDALTARILVAQEKPKNFQQNYMVDVNNIVAQADINVSHRQNVLGLIANIKGENCFCFANINLGNSVTSQTGTLASHSRKYLTSRFLYTIDFRRMLQTAGAITVDEQPTGQYINLAPEALTKTTIIDLLQTKAVLEK